MPLIVVVTIIDAESTVGAALIIAGLVLFATSGFRPQLRILAAMREQAEAGRAQTVA